MGDQDNRVLPLQLHDDRLQPRHQILVGFAPRVAVGVLVLVALQELFVELVVDVGVSHAVARSRIYFVQGLPSVKENMSSNISMYMSSIFYLLQQSTFFSKRVRESHLLASYGCQWEFLANS